MWRRPEPMTDTERREEIAQLEAARDRMLDRAPLSFGMSRIVMTMMTVMFLFVIANTLVLHRERVNWQLFIFVGLFGAIFLGAMRKLWWNPPHEHDRWGMSDRIGYDGDSPRDLQGKIDRLKTQGEKDL